jgi:hypothetical protein
MLMDFWIRFKTCPCVINRVLVNCSGSGGLILTNQNLPINRPTGNDVLNTKLIYGLYKTASPSKTALSMVKSIHNTSLTTPNCWGRNGGGFVLVL